MLPSDTVNTENVTHKQMSKNIQNMEMVESQSEKKAHITNAKGTKTCQTVNSTCCTFRIHQC